MIPHVSVVSWPDEVQPTMPRQLQLSRTARSREHFPSRRPRAVRTLHLPYLYQLCWIDGVTDGWWSLAASEVPWEHRPLYYLGNGPCF
jgi:hypothetical protein